MTSRKSESVRARSINAHLERFIEDGYTVIPQVFSVDETGRVLTANERIVAKVRARPDAYTTRYTACEEGLIDTWGVNRILEPALYEPDLASRAAAIGRLSWRDAEIRVT